MDVTDLKKEANNLIRELDLYTGRDLDTPRHKWVANRIMEIDRLICSHMNIKASMDKIQERLDARSEAKRIKLESKLRKSRFVYKRTV